MKFVLALLAAQCGIPAVAADVNDDPNRHASHEFTDDIDDINNRYAGLEFVNGMDDAPIEAPCSGHGSLSCECERGYEGVNCDEEIDYCAQSQTGFQGEFNNSAICGAFGICVSDVAKGASCACHSGYSGPFCATLPADSFVARRCVQPEIPIESGSDVVHCEDDERCLLDDLDCAHSRNAEVVEQCKQQKGYCLPDAKVKEILAHRQRQREQQIRCAAAANTYKSSVASATKCVNGLGTCTCDPGYEGDNCGQEVDFCSEPCPALKGGELGNVCGPHGTCQNSHEGIACICKDGFTGTYCNQAPSEVIEARRCVPHKKQAQANETDLHCEEHEHCVTDNLNCAYQGICEKNSRGYCVPNQPTPDPTQSPFHSTHAAHEGTTAAPIFVTTFPPISQEDCQERIDAAEAAEKERLKEEAEETESTFDAKLQNMTFKAAEDDFHSKLDHFKEVLDEKE